MKITLDDIATALGEDPAGAVLAGYGSRQIARAGGLLALARTRLYDVGDLRCICSDRLDALVAGLAAEEPLEIE